MLCCRQTESPWWCLGNPRKYSASGILGNATEAVSCQEQLVWLTYRPLLQTSPQILPLLPSCCCCSFVSSSSITRTVKRCLQLVLTQFYVRHRRSKKKRGQDITFNMLAKLQSFPIKTILQEIIWNVEASRGIPMVRSDIMYTKAINWSEGKIKRQHERSVGHVILLRPIPLFLGA